MPLPEAYKYVPPAILRNKELQFAPSVIPVRPHKVAIPGAIAEEEEWLAHMERLRGKEKLDQREYVSCAGFHASRHQQEPHAVALNALMPLFYENAHTVAMVKHGVGVIKNAIHHVDPGQIPVMAVDQPLYALASCVSMSPFLRLSSCMFSPMYNGNGTSRCTLCRMWPGEHMSFEHLVLACFTALNMNICDMVNAGWSVVVLAD